VIDIVAVWASGDGYGSRVVATLRRGTPNLGKVVKVLHDVWRPQFPYEEMWLDTRPSSVEALATAWEIELANEPNELHRALYRELRAVLDGASVEEAQEAR
jgi:hypothetical protein